MPILLLDHPGTPASDLIQWLNQHQLPTEPLEDPLLFLSSLSPAQSATAPPTGTSDAPPQWNLLAVNLSQPRGERMELPQKLHSQRIFLPLLGFDFQDDDLIPSLQAGYDDYLGKGFSPEQFEARAQALLRRAAYAGEITTLIAGDISLDLLKRQARRGKKLVELQPREFAMLEFMIRNQNRPLSKLLIMQNVWNYNFDPQTNIVDVLICRLRNKIDSGYACSVIRTVRGVGYMFTPAQG